MGNAPIQKTGTFVTLSTVLVDFESQSKTIQSGFFPLLEQWMLQQNIPRPIMRDIREFLRRATYVCNELTVQSPEQSANPQT